MRMHEIRRESIPKISHECHLIHLVKFANLIWIHFSSYFNLYIIFWIILVRNNNFIVQNWQKKKLARIQIIIWPPIFWGS